MKDLFSQIGSLHFCFFLKHRPQLINSVHFVKVKGDHVIVKVIFLIKFVVTEAPRKDILLKLVVTNYENDSFHQTRLQVIMFFFKFELYLLAFFSANFPCQ